MWFVRTNSGDLQAVPTFTWVDRYIQHHNMWVNRFLDAKSILFSSLCVTYTVCVTKPPWSAGHHRIERLYLDGVHLNSRIDCVCNCTISVNAVPTLNNGAILMAFPFSVYLQDIWKKLQIHHHHLNLCLSVRIHALPIYMYVHATWRCEDAAH